MNNPFQQIDARLSNIESLLLDLKHGDIKSKPAVSPVVPIIPEDHPQTVPQAAEFLGLSIQTVYDKIHNKEIPHYKPPGSKRVYFSKKDLTDYINAGKIHSKNQIEAEAESIARLEEITKTSPLSKRSRVQPKK